MLLSPVNPLVLVCGFAIRCCLVIGSRLQAVAGRARKHGIEGWSARRVVARVPAPARPKRPTCAGWTHSSERGMDGDRAPGGQPLAIRPRWCAVLVLTMFDTGCRHPQLSRPGATWPARGALEAPDIAHIQNAQPAVPAMTTRSARPVQEGVVGQLVIVWVLFTASDRPI